MSIIKDNNLTLEKIYNLINEPDNNLNTKIAYSHPIKTNNKSIRLNIGRIWFNLLMPDDYQLIDKPVDKKVMDSIIADLIEKYPTDVVSDIITKLQIEAFKLSTINPRSFSIDAFTYSDKWKKAKNDFQKKIPTLTDKEYIDGCEELSKDLMSELNEKGVGLQDVIGGNASGKASPETWKALVVSRGYNVDIEGNMSRISEGIADGYNLENYYKTAAQARATFFIKSTESAKPGYLARKITMACANLTISEHDCKTKNYLGLQITKQNAKVYLGRYYLENNKLKLVQNVNDIIDKKIKLRSPLYCKSPNGICEICYGELWRKLGNKNIGIIAGGAINYEAINSMMKARHKTTFISIIDVDFITATKKAADQNTINLFFEVDKKKLTAKRDLMIIIDSKDYNDESLIDLGDRFLIPGIINVCDDSDPENNINFTLPYNFKVNLYKPENIEEDKTVTILRYSKGEKVIEQDQVIKDMDQSIVDRLFEGGIKYVNTPETLLDMIRTEMPGGDSCHIELIISNMFRSKDDNTIPGRLVDYKNCEVLGCRKVVYIDSWLAGVAFENINKAIKMALIEQKPAKNNPVEKVLIEKYYGEDSEF